jgi:hypothetical protein
VAFGGEGNDTLLVACGATTFGRKVKAPGVARK